VGGFRLPLSHNSDFGFAHQEARPDSSPDGRVGRCNANPITGLKDFRRQHCMVLFVVVQSLCVLSIIGEGNQVGRGLGSLIVLA
jgi:hypothetical protein